MTRSDARAVGDLVVFGAGMVAAYVVLTRPSLRRLAFTLVELWLGASLPIYLVRQTRRAWEESAAPPD